MTEPDYEAALYGTAGSTRALATPAQPTRDCLIVRVHCNHFRQLLWLVAPTLEIVRLSAMI